MGTASTQSKIFAGYRLDGTAVYAPVTLTPGEIICPECEGNGTVVADYGRGGFQKLCRETCESCDGAGVLEIEIGEEE